MIDPVFDSSTDLAKQLAAERSQAARKIAAGLPARIARLVQNHQRHARVRSGLEPATKAVPKIPEAVRLENQKVAERQAEYLRSLEARTIVQLAQIEKGKEDHVKE